MKKKFRTCDHDVHNPIEKVRTKTANQFTEITGNYLNLWGNQIMTLRGFGDYQFNNPQYYPNGIVPPEGGVISRIPEINIVDLEEGDLIIATSDGLVETFNGKLVPGRDESEIYEDAYEAVASGTINIALELINRKVERLTTLYMEKKNMDPKAELIRQSVKVMLEKAMDNHVVITHIVGEPEKTDLRRSSSI